MTAQNDDYLTTTELAKRWKVSQGTIRNMRFRRVGPPYFKPNGERGLALYKLADVLAYEATHTVGGEQA